MQHAHAALELAARGLADTLSQEVLLYPQDVRVHIVFPGTILSPGFEVEERTKPAITKQLEAADPKQTPDEVARAARTLIGSLVTNADPRNRDVEAARARARSAARFETRQPS